MRRALCWAAALSLCGCLPDPRGRCQADADCAGGPPGLFCAGGVCQAGPSAVLDEVPRGSLARSQTAVVRVRLLSARGTPTLSLRLAGIDLPAVLEADGRFRFDVPLGLAPKDAEGSVAFSVTVGDDSGHPLVLGDALVVDDLAPRISVDPASVPTAAVLRGTLLALHVTLTDLSPATLRYQAGSSGGAATALADGSFSVPLDTSAAAPGATELTVQLTAADSLANSATTTVQVPLTRLKWKAQNQSNAAIVGIALSSDAVIATQKQDTALLLSRKDGSETGRPSIGGAALGNVATDGSTFYVARTDYQLCKIGLDGATRWCCGPFGVLAGGAAVGPLPALHGTTQQTAVIATGNASGNTDGERLYALRDAADGSCDFHPSTQIAKFKSATPSIAQDATVYAGGLQAVVAAQFDGLAWTPMQWPETTNYQGQPALRAAASQGQAALFSSTQGFVDLLGFANPPFSAAPTESAAQAAGSQLAGATSATLAADGTAVVGTDDAFVVALDPAGTVRWRVALPSPPTTSATQGDGGVLYLGTLDGTLFALSLSDGSVLWQFAAGAAVHTPPALGCDGTLYFGADDGAVFALATDSKGLSNSPWPREGHDSRGTGDARRPLRSASGACQE